MSTPKFNSTLLKAMLLDSFMDVGGRPDPAKLRVAILIR